MNKIDELNKLKDALNGNYNIIAQKLVEIETSIAEENAQIEKEQMEKEVMSRLERGKLLKDDNAEEETIEEQQYNEVAFREINQRMENHNRIQNLLQSKFQVLKEFPKFYKNIFQTFTQNTIFFPVSPNVNDVQFNEQELQYLINNNFIQIITPEPKIIAGYTNESNTHFSQKFDSILFNTPAILITNPNASINSKLVTI